MHKLPKLVAVSAMAMSLAGCQSMPLIGHWFGKSGNVAERPAPALAGAQVLEEGRAQLRSGQISAAVASFRIARMDPATAADANNGLGVAYIRLGRMDLADRYFRTALELEPENDRFAANLMRLRHDVMLARRARVEAERLAANTATAATESSPQLAQAQEEQGATRRISRSPVIHIATRTQNDDAAPSIEVVSAPWQRETLSEAMADLPQVAVADVMASLPEVSAAKVQDEPGPMEIVFSND